MKMYLTPVVAVIATSLILTLPVRCKQLDNLFPNTRPLLKLASHGGPNGSQFDDLKNVTGIYKIQAIAIGSLNQVDYIQITYVLSNGTVYKAPEHGDGIFTPDVITLAPDEYLEKLEGLTNGEYVNQLIVTTYSPKDDIRNVYGPYGTPKLNATQNFTFEGNIIGFHGAVGKIVLSNLGVYILAPAKKSEIFGNASLSNTTHFVDDPDGSFPPVVKISKLYVHHGIMVNALQAEYELLGGGTRKGPHNGGHGGLLAVLSFEPDEHIVCIKGKLIDSPSPSLGQLSFLTLNSRNHTKTYGPFGVRGTKEFSLHSNVIGFAGSFHKAVQAIGVFYFQT